MEKIEIFKELAKKDEDSLSPILSPNKILKQDNSTLTMLGGLLLALGGFLLGVVIGRKQGEQGMQDK